ncbi:hypothetical protein AAFN88_20675 [Pelagibius sp. CAU 1746]|uniref:hypothetical protein n=1 Tax=Pelagibius sp. CAU 1746 TaxID=3140370 RepID=UPI00325B10E2
MPGKNTVVASINAPGSCASGGSRCVDVFRRPDGTFGFEEYRRDAEDPRGWFPVGFFGDQVFDGAAAALAQARRQISWLAAIKAPNFPES